ncbi:MAG: hypothetical protein ACJ72Q_08765 [Nitrososphaeraceae archaeon]
MISNDIQYKIHILIIVITTQKLLYCSLISSFFLRQDTNTTTSLAIILAERLMGILIYGVAEADVDIPNK